MLNPKYKRYAERMKQLIEEGQEIESTAKIGIVNYIPDLERLHSWLTKTTNIVTITFGTESQHFKKLSKLLERRVDFINEFKSIKGLLVGALDDLEGGFLIGQEFLIAGEIFDSMLEQARELNKKGYKDPAAVLARVVVEDSLRRIARKENLDYTKKATVLNDQLWKANRYGQPRWKRVQFWLTVGNSAAHGKFDEYNSDDVKTIIEEVERFLAEELLIG